MSEGDDKQKHDAVAAKPVVVHIYGPYLDLEPYEDAVALKKVAEAHGQPYLLIPPPNAEGKPSVSPKSKDYNLEYIKTQLGKEFGKGGRYAGRDHVDLISTHGMYQFESYGHRHQLGDGNKTDSKDLYQALLSINGRCLGVQDGACYSGAGLVGFNEALRATAGQHENPIPFTATSRFNRPTTSWNNNLNLQQLKLRVDRGEIITPEGMKASFLMNMVDVNATVTKTFDPKHLDPEWAVHYDDLQTGLERFYKEFHDKPDTMPSTDRFSALLKKHLLTPEKYEKIQEALKQDNVARFRENLARDDLFGVAMAIADTHYGQVNNAMLNKQRFMGGQTQWRINGVDVPNIFADTGWQKNFITDPEKQKEAFIFAAHEDPVAFVGYASKLKDRFSPKEMLELLKFGAEKEPRHFLHRAHFLKSQVSEDDRNQLLAVAARSAVKHHSYEVFANAKVWKDAIPDPQERVELLKAAAMASPEDCINNVGNWQSLFSEQEKEAIMKAASEKAGVTSPQANSNDTSKKAIPENIPHALSTALAQYHDTNHVPASKPNNRGPGNVPLISSDIAGQIT